MPCRRIGHDRAHADAAKYGSMYASSASTPDAFWAEHGKRIDWIKPFTKVKNTSFEPGEVSIKWFEDGTTNVAMNCIDRHLARRADQVAIIWEGDDPGESRHITYAQLHDQVCRFANVLKNHGVRKGDTVTIYLPMIPEAAYAMLACARIGAVHSIVFGGFSPDALAGRIEGCQSRVVITADEGLRGGRKVPLKVNADEAVKKAGGIVETMIVVKRTGGRDRLARWPRRLVCGRSRESFGRLRAGGNERRGSAVHPLHVGFDRGSQGRRSHHRRLPRFCIDDASICLRLSRRRYLLVYRRCRLGHRPQLYRLRAAGQRRDHADVRGGSELPVDVAVLGGRRQAQGQHLLHRADRDPFADGRGGRAGKQTSRASLRLLGSVGEPINPEAWEWYHRVVGDQRCPIVDTWWQTETGGILISPLPGATALKPGSATLPFFGVMPEVVDANGAVLAGACEGNLVIANSWPGQMRTVYGDHERFMQTYFATYPGKYFTGDGCRRDADGYYWITGRVDDVINVSGHRMGTAEVESALVAHQKVSEAAVVGFPHDIKGQGIYAYVTLMADAEPSGELRKELVAWVRKEIGPIAAPDVIQFAPGLPKTRSGKIMRRILRKIAEDEVGALGDTSTLADPAVVDDLIKNRHSRKAASK